MSWYTDDKGSNLEGGLSGCGARFFLRHMIGHVLDDMNAAVEVLEKSENIHWNTIHAPGLRKGNRKEKEIISNSSDRVQAIIGKVLQSWNYSFLFGHWMETKNLGRQVPLLQNAIPHDAIRRCCLLSLGRYRKGSAGTRNSNELESQYPVSENKVNLPENRKIAISYKHSLAEPEFNTLWPMATNKERINNAHIYLIQILIFVNSIWVGTIFRL